MKWQKCHSDSFLRRCEFGVSFAGRTFDTQCFFFHPNMLGFRIYCAKYRNIEISLKEIIKWGIIIL